ncbi:MAG: hypothetical protein Q4C87_04325 [Actinomycetaceae bacterium]|nr:hypothetical protein [Actinomycetaceae bacterium]
MSTAAARTRPASRPERLRESAAPHLQVVDGVRSQRSIVPMALLTLVVLAIAIVVPMIVNTRMAETSFAIREQQLVLNELEAQTWGMQTELEQRASPTTLQEAARKAGMVPAGRTGFIRLSTGTVEGGEAAR